MKEFVEPWKSLEAEDLRGRRVDLDDQGTFGDRDGPCLLGLLGDLLELLEARPDLLEAIQGRVHRRGYC